MLGILVLEEILESSELARFIPISSNIVTSLPFRKLEWWTPQKWLHLGLLLHCLDLLEFNRAQHLCVLNPKSAGTELWS
jgi:hypothetical protein